jgi:hypothetical protein
MEYALCTELRDFKLNKQPEETDEALDSEDNKAVPDHLCKQLFSQMGSALFI